MEICANTLFVLSTYITLFCSQLFPHDSAFWSSFCISTFFFFPLMMMEASVVWIHLDLLTHPLMMGLSCRFHSGGLVCAQSDSGL